MTDWTAVNRASWDERAPAHVASPDYAVQQFIDDPEFLSGVVRFDLPRLGDVAGLRGVHLQCHIGTDTISLARLGAQMTGLDFSAPALEQAADLAARTGAQVEWVESELYGAPDVLPVEAFDFVFTGIGALCWLPDITGWARVVAGLLRPGGRLFLREGHPSMWSIQHDRDDELLVVKTPYFNRAEPNVFDEAGSYVATDQEFEHTVSADWSHGIGEIITACLEAGLQLTAFEEHDTVPWEPFDSALLERDELGERRLKDEPWRLPMSYTLQAVKAS